jgi:hypothetical protein
MLELTLLYKVLVCESEDKLRELINPGPIPEVAAIDLHDFLERPQMLYNPILCWNRHRHVSQGLDVHSWYLPTILF